MNLRQKTSLTVKMVMVTIILGVSLWALLDFIQSNELKKIFYVQLFEKLTKQSMEDRLHIDRYIRSHNQSAKIIVAQKSFSDYILSRQWSAKHPVHIDYLSQVPKWYLKSSALRILARPRYAILLDPMQRVREVYFSRHYPPPNSMLLEPSPLLLSKGLEQSFVINIENVPYIITSERLLGKEGESLATLMLASPIDEEFINSAKGPFIPSRLLALVSIEDESRIIVSSNHKELPPGTTINELEDRFLVTGHHAYDYGAAEYILKLISLVSISEVDKLTESVIKTGRYQRNIIAPAFVITFTIIMFLITRRINRLNNRMSDFSEQTLGIQKQELQKGDQLYILEKRFERLTEEVIEAREMLTKQAEEKTQLIIKNVFDAIITMDSDGKIMTWNPQAEVTFGWKHKEIAGRKVVNTIIPYQLRETHKNGLAGFLETGENDILNRQIQMTALHRDGHEFPVELAVSPAKQGNNIFFIAIIRDISERRNAENKIKSSLHEKEVLLKEVHHRVKNNMQVISSLLNLQSGYIEDSKYKAMFKESRNRIRSMALVHEKLYRSEDLAKINIYDYINSLAINLYHFYDTSTSRIALQIEAKDIALDINTAIPCGLIINELLSNALKHAFKANEKGKITITLHKIPDKNSNIEYEMIIKDNGAGIPVNFDIMESTSLGLQLVTNLIQHQLSSEFNLNRSDGTEFKIRFKEMTYQTQDLV